MTRLLRVLIIRAGVLLGIAAPAIAQTPPNWLAPIGRLDVLTAVLKERYHLFQQDLLINGCSLSRPAWDSVSTTTGNLGSEFAAAVRGKPGQCYKSGQLRHDDLRMLYLVGMARRDDPRFPSSITFAVHVQVVNERAEETYTEEWILQLSRVGSFSLVSMRIVDWTISE